MGFIERFFGVLINPSITFKEINENPKLLEAFSAILIAGLCAGVGGALNLSLIAQEIAHPLIPPIVLIVSAPLGYFLMWVVISCILYASAKVFGGTGAFEASLILLSFAFVPAIFLAPLGVVAYAIGVFGAFIYAFGSFVISIWGMILAVFAIKEHHKLSTLRAVMAVFIPVLVIAIIIFVLAFIAIIYLEKFLTYPISF